MKTLTAKREKFCLSHQATGNGCEAYRQAFETSGMSQRTIEKRASELLQDGEVKGRLAQLRAEAADKATLSRAWILDRLMRNAAIALGDQKVTLTVKPRGKDGQAAAPVTMEVTVRDANAANKALELLARHLGMFVDRVEHSGKDGKDLFPEYSDMTKLEMARQVAHMLREGAQAAARLKAAKPGDEPAENHEDKS